MSPQPRLPVRATRSALALVSLTLLVSACSSGLGADTPATDLPDSATTSAPVSVVASTDVYADIVQTIGGNAVRVTSFINDPNRNPHDYPADARNQLAVSRAQLVVENGGGYDDFVDTMLSATTTKPTVVNVTALSGYNPKPTDGEFNEHLWYDLPTMVKLTSRLRTELAALAPRSANTIAANATDFTHKLQALQQTEARIKTEHAGDGVAITEPLPIYLLAAVGLSNKTPEAFSQAIEEGDDVPPAAMQQTLKLLDSGDVKLLAYDAQNAGPQPDAVLAAAKRNHIPVASFTETLPAGDDYLSWMRTNIHAILVGLAASS